MNAWLTALVVVGALTVSALGGWGVVAGLLRVASRSPDSGPVDEGVASPPVPPAAPPASVQPLAPPGRADAQGWAVPERWAEPYDDPDDPEDSERSERPGEPGEGHRPGHVPPSPWPSPWRFPEQTPPPEPARPTEPDEPGPLRGGTWIGVLERLAVTGVLLAGYPAGVAFVIAIKGLGRYPELREHPGSSERFVIGTLGSLVWAAACGIVGAALLGTRVLGV